jgi:hypothetical protein
VIQAEVDVRETEPAGALRRVLDAPDALERLSEPLHVDRAELEEQRVLVPEMVIDRRRGVLDLPGDGAHGHRLDAIANEQIACGIEYLGANGVAGAGPPLESAHGSSLTPLSNAGQGPS